MKTFTESLIKMILILLLLLITNINHATTNFETYYANDTTSSISIPDAPILISPENGELNPTTLDWNDVEYAETYTVFISTEVYPTLSWYSVPTSEVTLTNLADGIYYWRVEASNSMGSRSSLVSSFRIDRRPCNLTVNAGADQEIFLDSGTESVELTAAVSGGSGPFTYLWNPGGAVTNSITVSPLTTTTYTVEVTDNNNCTATDEVIVNVYNTVVSKNFVVNTIDDIDDGVCNEEHCSLREAIKAANTNGNMLLDSISFNIPGTGPYTIQPLSPLPEITDPILIDGCTQPGYAGSPLIELNGSEAEDWASGLNITAGNSTIRGLVISGFGDAGIRLALNGGNIIEGNYIGTDVSGTSRSSNGQGIYIESPHNLIGGISVSERNIISGNRYKGVWINGEHSNFNSVINNFIGVDVSGENGLGNGEYGIGVDWASNNRIAGNIISNNGGSGSTGEWPGIGIVENTASGNRIFGNKIGVTVSGRRLGNAWNGVWIGDAPNTRIGGTNPGEGNIISGNGFNGILINGESATGNRISGNRIFNNELLGIDLEPNPGVTPNDQRDLDNGPNMLQNYPVINEAQALENVIVGGYLQSSPNTTYTIEFFKNSFKDNLLYGEGKVFLVNNTVTTNNTGYANFHVEFPNAEAGDIITATATDPGNNTSEFSRDWTVLLPIQNNETTINNGGYSDYTASISPVSQPSDDEDDDCDCSGESNCACEPSYDAVFGIIWPGSDIVLTLNTPSGQIYNRTAQLPDNVRHILTDTSETYIVNNPEAGEWNIELYGKEVSEGGEIVKLQVFEIPKYPLKTVSIDVQPGDDVGTLNCADKEGVIPIAILTTEDFDATQIDHTTVHFGACGSEVVECHTNKKGLPQRHEEDVDGDGDLDLVFHFLFKDTGIKCNDNYAVLTGFTYDGKMVRGTDAIRTVGGDGSLPKNSLLKENSIPTAFKLQQSFPNPFNPTTVIRYELPEQCFVNIEVYNILGQRVSVLKNSYMEPGYYEVLFDGKNLASGTYIYKIQAGNFIDIKKMILMK